MDEQAPQVMTATPPERPVSMHRHSAAPILAGLLGLLLVAETAFMGWGATQFFAVKDGLHKVSAENDQLKTDLAKAEAEKDTGAPNFYVQRTYPGPYGAKLFSIDQKTGEGTQVVDVSPNSVLRVVAVPAVGYDGRIFVHLAGEGGDDPYLHLQELKVEDGTLAPLTPSTPAGTFILMDAIAVSPDGTRLAYVPFNDMADLTTPPSPTIFIYDLLTGKSEELARLSATSTPAGFSFAQHDANAFAGMVGLDFAWKDNACVIASVYSSAASDAKLSYETFCSKK
jgi:hypothetical protein